LAGACTRRVTVGSGITPELPEKARGLMTRLVSVAILSAVALVLYLLEFPLLPAATYLKMDFSDIPAVFGGVLFGPAYGKPTTSMTATPLTQARISPFTRFHSRRSIIR